MSCSRSNGVLLDRVVKPAETQAPHEIAVITSIGEFSNDYMRNDDSSADY